MSILIKSVRVSGFRGIKEIEVELGRIAVLLGTNNAGKTSFLKSLQLALGDYQRYFSDEDLHIDSSGLKANEVIVDLKIIPTDEHYNKTEEFDEKWIDVFGDNIALDANGYEFVAIRTKVQPDEIKGGFNTQRYYLNEWGEFEGWKDIVVNERRKVRTKVDAIPYICIEAQRDIHHELKDKNSYIGKVLSYIKYEDEDVTALEEMISSINETAVSRSEPLQSLKNSLQGLNQSFLGSSHTEITPFPKKIRDLSKQFTVHFGDEENHSFSMEYHGTGTRSWASMLTVQSFLSFMHERHELENKALHPIVGAEEPEAHLHPNAQRTLFKQLSSSQGQIILSTHSPYLSAMAEIEDIRSFIKKSDGVTVNCLKKRIEHDERNALKREIMLTRGELLFSRALILCEGVTEEQLIPSMFELYFGRTMFCIGVNCISVSGKNYPPFIKLASNLGIPVCIISDNDGDTRGEINRQVARLVREDGLVLNPDCFSLEFLKETNDIEAELYNELNIREEIIESLVLSETKASPNERYRDAKKREIEALQDNAIIEKMRDSKASYAGYLGVILAQNANGKRIEELLPESVIIAFNKVRGWLEL
ncbi:ATP-dependent nuclease [Klebsiella variicola]|uniref:ATP-dependent nuclease n=1 Tax=Klebsiella variicola TaxID=244366 RepID=UPI0012ABDCFA|nr:AAA family ATPase [Klebsiella variicola]HCI6131122.1 AAA family ATPase [Klebsiella variicola subsp. variicola]EKK1837133.1 AAA family ATPase [Klebsiella variicola]MBA6167465.1 AAA family ATPase [Klebsiella variicola]MBA6183108.1 AAA family ATPase [Klebsiella variicola]MDZ0575647.1 AAA family ATPase [Klebsiella variicola]